MESKYVRLNDDLDGLPEVSIHDLGHGASLATAVVRNPIKVLVAFGFLTVSSVFWSIKLFDMKEGILFIPTNENSIFKDFAASSDLLYDAMVFWCDNCDVVTDTDFSSSSANVIQRLRMLRRQEPTCGDISWSWMQSPDANLGQAFYLSTDKTTTFIEFHSVSMPCMLAARADLKELTVASGTMRMALGGPETAATASMGAEFLTTLKHSMVATPIFSIILWMVTGNVFKAVSPMICVVASYLTGKGALGICKCYFPTLNVNFDDSCVLFIVLALCVDYALFVWTRFNDMRAAYPSREDYKDVLVAAAQKSGMVIVISNLFVTIAWFQGMFFPFMNLWGYLGLYFQAAIASACSMIYTLTVLPALAASAPHLFDGSDPIAAKWHTKIWGYLPSPHDLWLKWSRIITRKPLMFLIPLIAYAVMGYCIMPLDQYKPSFDIEVQGIRHDVIEGRALAQFEKKFNVGMLYPVKIVLEATYLGPAEDVSDDEERRFRNVALTPEF
eukprot:gnl/TRDRNA2_/TRDRNA2_157932_c1_seq1.p1 gnl/TRDRNA2_/TRDRNA2_157932_c1~~gnl/TRDRNA2_/TRDRNA2_157932_c1_seq1.p1  ORF type:complete len:500 (+),score=94.81 gnl/TRDRNA2_/TRDRNA2_157932_c1_seq1:89-1588(+)